MTWHPSSRPLRKGDRIRERDGAPVYRVVRVTPCGATVREVGKRRVVVNGREFKARGRVSVIALNSEVERWRK